MSRVRRHADRTLAMLSEVELMVARATGQSEEGPAFQPTEEPSTNDRPPRYPAVGLHPWAIDGTLPHRNSRLDGWPAVGTLRRRVV